MLTAIRPIFATQFAVAIKRKKLDRTVNLTECRGRVIDIAPSWVFTIDCPYHGRVHFNFDRYRLHDRDELAGQMRDAIWSMRHEAVGKTLQCYENTGLRTFWGFLDQLHRDGECITRLDQIDLFLLERFIAWMGLQVVSYGKNRGLPWSISAKKNVFSWIKTILINRQKKVPEATSPNLEFPCNPFPNSNRLSPTRNSYSTAEQKRILDAVNKDLHAIHDDQIEALTNVQVLAVHLIILGMATGRNLQSLLELQRNDLKDHPLADRDLLVTTKRRGWSTHATSLRRSAVMPEKQETMRTIPISIGDHIRFICDLTAPLIGEADEKDRGYIFLHRAHRLAAVTGIVHLSAKAAARAVEYFARRHLLMDDFGAPLKLNVARLRPTFATELYRRTRDLRSVQQALGHCSAEITARHYVNKLTYAERDHALTLDSMVGKFAHIEVNGQLLLAADGKFPLQHINELFSGGYNTGVARCRNPFRDDESICKKFFACFTCLNMVVFEDDLWRLFSFYFRLLSERINISPVHWMKTYGPIIRRIDMDIASQFPSDKVASARLRAQQNPHPAWRLVPR